MYEEFPWEYSIALPLFKGTEVHLFIETILAKRIVMPNWHVGVTAIDTREVKSYIMDVLLSTLKEDELFLEKKD